MADDSALPSIKRGIAARGPLQQAAEMSGAAAPSTASAVDQMSSPQEPAYEMKSEGEEGLGTPLDPPSGLTSTEEGLAPVVPEEKDVIPEGGYGWVIVICVALINAVTWGEHTSQHAAQVGSS